MADPLASTKGRTQARTSNVEGPLNMSNDGAGSDKDLARQLSPREREIILEWTQRRAPDEEPDCFPLGRGAIMPSYDDEESRTAIESLRTVGLAEFGGNAPTERGRAIAEYLVVRCVDQVALSTAKDFLDYLDLGDERWGTRIDVNWVFRGHGDSRWTLKPFAWRHDGRAVLQPLYDRLHRRRAMERAIAGSHDDRSFDSRDPTLWCAAEFAAVLEFASTSDSLGLAVPGLEDLPLFEEYWRAAMSEVSPNAAFALAQHHGVPTELLDFTEDPIVAALFAAKDGLRVVAERDKEVGPEGAPDYIVPDHVAVWALNTDLVARMTRAEQHTGIPVDLEMFTVKRSENAFLHAQRGVFVWDRYASRRYTARGKWPRLDETLDTIYTSGEKPLRQILLPTNECDEVLRRLWRRGVNPARLMPSYHHVVSALRMNWSIEEEQRWKCGNCGRANPAKAAWCSRCQNGK